MRAIDTNLLVRLLVRDDPQQTPEAEAFVSKGAWVSHLVLAETLWVLSSLYDRSAADLLKVVEMLLSHEVLSLQDPEVIRAALEQFRKRTKPGFTDCLVLEIARKAGHLPLGTFDRELGKLEGTQRM